MTGLRRSARVEHGIGMAETREAVCMASRVAIATLLAGVSLACASPDAPAASRPEPVIASLVLTIGDDESLGGEYLFGSVASVALDPAGRIYVADRTDSSLRVYSRDGGYLRAIGREGEGPGEFQVPLDLVFSANGDLWVRDLNRIQQLVRSVNGTIPDSVVRTHPLTGYANTRPDRAGVADSLYYYPSYSYPLSGAARYFYEVSGLSESRTRSPSLRCPTSIGCAALPTAEGGSTASSANS